MRDVAKLGIIAGRGDLPRLIAEHRAVQNAPYLVISFDQDTQSWMRTHPHEEHLHERPARLFCSLKKAGVEEVCFAGATSRPRLRPWLFDYGALKILTTVLRLLRRGDDALLTALAQIFEYEGFAVRGADEILPGLGVQAGILGRHRPGEQDRADAVRGASILAVLSTYDVSQAIVIAGGVCLGIEAIDGTDAMLDRVASLPPELRKASPPPSGVLVKIPKRYQDLRVDMPTVGKGTVKAASAAGLAGIVLEAGGANLLDRKATVAAADRAGLFLWAMDSVS